MVLGDLDITFCTNRLCAKSDRCGRSIKRLDGGRFIVSMAGYKPDADGTCRMEMEYQEYQPNRQLEHMLDDYDMEQTLQKELADSNSLDPKRK